MLSAGHRPVIGRGSGYVRKPVAQFGSLPDDAPARGLVIGPDWSRKVWLQIGSKGYGSMTE